MEISFDELKFFLDEKVYKYNTIDFIELDPISVPHQFSLKEDIEISAFLASTIAWGNRKTIVKNANRMMDLMDNSPYDFVMNHSDHDLEKLAGFVHRTFNGEDFKYFIKSLNNTYNNYGGLEPIFVKHQTEDSLQPAIMKFNEIFFELPHLKRNQKHIANPAKGSVAKPLYHVTQF